MGLEDKRRAFIFLDIDGVLNNELYIEDRWNMNGEHAMHMSHVPFDPKCLYNLMILVRYMEQEYNVKIILSSTWRLHEEDYNLVNARLAEYGLVLSGKTNCINHARGIEIKNFLIENNYIAQYDEFIILDDEKFDIVDIFPDRLIQTDFKTGFNVNSLIKTINKVNEWR